MVIFKVKNKPLENCKCLGVYFCIFCAGANRRSPMKNKLFKSGIKGPEVIYLTRHFKDSAIVLDFLTFMTVENFCMFPTGCDSCCDLDISCF
jgi:hypothetical protein